jgi:hypothetical protein
MHCFVMEITERQYNLLKIFDGNLEWAKETVNALERFVK